MHAVQAEILYLIGLVYRGIGRYRQDQGRSSNRRPGCQDSRVVTVRIKDVAQAEGGMRFPPRRASNRPVFSAREGFGPVSRLDNERSVRSEEGWSPASHARKGSWQ